MQIRRLIGNSEGLQCRCMVPKGYPGTARDYEHERARNAFIAYRDLASLPITQSQNTRVCKSIRAFSPSLATRSSVEVNGAIFLHKLVED